MRRGPIVALAGVSGLAAALAWSEWLNRRWSRTLVVDAAGPTQAVVVLGFRNTGPAANVVNRWRVRAGLRSIDPAARARLVLSGGATTSGRSEARVLADHAVGVLGYDGPLALEEESRTTWENVARVLPLVEDADRITIVSQPAHALKARVYVARQRPDLVGRLTRGADHRWGEWLLLKPALAAYGLWTLRGVRRDLRPR
ncbi:YdcF family protein [Isoptericola nanjingensis]|uniref:YdcF family protein n=1 Tax=Isoptericola TaxID=254250 RepID=UPI003D1FD2F3|nr:YdcF family protein [Isoptericola sp. QY 916]